MQRDMRDAFENSAKVNRNVDDCRRDKYLTVTHPFVVKSIDLLLPQVVVLTGLAEGSVLKEAFRYLKKI